MFGSKRKCFKTLLHMIFMSLSGCNAGIKLLEITKILEITKTLTNIYTSMHFTNAEDLIQNYIVAFSNW